MKLVKEHLLDCADYLETLTPEEAESVCEYFVNINNEGKIVCWPAAYLFLRDKGLDKTLNGVEKHISVLGTGLIEKNEAFLIEKNEALQFVYILEKHLGDFYYFMLDDDHLSLASKLRIMSRFHA